MKKLTLFFSLLLITGFVDMLKAQTADEIIANYFEVIGGEEKLAAIKSMKITGNAQAQGMDIPIQMYQKAPNKMKMTMNFQGQEITQMSFNGQSGWSTNFMTMQPEAWDAEQSYIAKHTNQFPDPFIGYKENGYSVNLEGEEDLNGSVTYKIKLTREPLTLGEEQIENYSYHYFDKESGVMLKQTDFGKTGQQKGMTIDTYYSDYDEVDGIYFAFSMEQKMNEQTAFAVKFDKVELDTEMDDAIFELPAKTLTDDK